MTVRYRLAAVAVALATAVAACGGGGDDAVLTGFRTDPAPDVGAASLPDVSNGGQPFAFTAPPGGLLVVYFGYTNCPDFCPTTMSDLKLALNRIGDDASRVEVAMVTVDPDRDLAIVPERCDVPILDCYITSFIADGHALGTTDTDALRAAAQPFGVGYDVRTGDDGSVEVDHTTFLYAVDDSGRLVLTWQFGVAVDDLAADLQALLDGASA
jgi:protein SCO1/2